MTATFARILVPTDFSAHSEAALGYARALAKQSGSSLELLHVLEDPFMPGTWSAEVYLPDVPTLREQLAADAEGRLAGYRENIHKEGIPIVTTIRSGRPAEIILEHAKAAGADLIVMGTHGRSGLSHLFMGSVAERVIRTATCPVLTVRETSGEVKRQQANAAA
jgi:nucleotide-binding universal stress UspA family protein